MDEKPDFPKFNQLNGWSLGSGVLKMKEMSNLVSSLLGAKHKG